ncbi:MAG: dihydropteroate synthase [Bacteroidaceae bacterium]|nr:dihydropteroate synthase [Bacteroidaceae bacterium]
MEEGTKSIRIGDKLLSVATPAVMGIVNVTDNSFYAPSRIGSAELVVMRAQQMVAEGAAVIDIGACSTRPGAEPVSEEEEKARLLPVLEALSDALLPVPLSVDTFRASVVEACLSVCEAFIVNDVSGCADEKMAAVVAKNHLPYILTHNSREKKEDCSCKEADIVNDVRNYFCEMANKLHAAGVKDVILDPGFGFGKTLDENYRLLVHLCELRVENALLLAGVSRKSMIQRVLSLSADEALNGTTVLHTIALQQGADILRVHDVREACETIQLMQQIKRQTI